MASGTGVPSTGAPHPLIPPAPHSVADPVDQSPGHAGLRRPPPDPPRRTSHPQAHRASGPAASVDSSSPSPEAWLLRRCFLPSPVLGPGVDPEGDRHGPCVLAELPSSLNLSRGRAKGRGFCRLHPQSPDGQGSVHQALTMFSLRGSVRFYRRAMPSLCVAARGALPGRCSQGL